MIDKKTATQTMNLTTQAILILTMDLEEHSEINQSDEEPSESELDSPSSQESDEIFSFVY